MQFNFFSGVEPGSPSLDSKKYGQIHQILHTGSRNVLDSVWRRSQSTAVWKSKN